jgi:hypothetical protein
MSQATLQMRSFAERVLACEPPGREASEAKTLEAFQVFDKLRPHLATLMGNGGFRALLSRALALANAEISWLSAVNVKADGSLEGLKELRGQLDPAAFFESSVVLLAQLLGLLVAFIGEDLTVRLVREVWPKVSLNDLDLDLDSGNGIKYEIKK